ncbi:bifunctional adenosylcobinamide kinase/adenosylcobinamide-phosphate guanylyltransferase [Heliobacterium gestii]|uniref:Adenosylcobinamide kinase n=1 Tax=Heliomicrobium gestii TaxID=2699 RepID=A0A845LEG0_HELGE|nr:bifunctional adenosylcobinamide kinase/adenosylcobinamide-phosphate guanylyltransferase [Heliomicrobium gestii]MZP43764.1 bifunctional adenosylcobinamide kinase/adenosylcobinamide-phosphate guanylyltransferase [Heliomicrobium gestii]
MHIHPGELVLVTGGARSGKSAWAEQLAVEAAGATPEQVVYVATAGVFDEEMRRRVNTHRQRRPAAWQTVEEPVDLERVIDEWDQAGRVILIDCLTLWTTNLMLPEYREEDWNTQKEDAIVDLARRTAKRASLSKATVIAVGNEVGWGIVPPEPISRAFRDAAGRVQQAFAAEAHRVYLTVSGCPLQVKGAQAPLQGICPQGKGAE